MRVTAGLLARQFPCSHCGDPVLCHCFSRTERGRLEWLRARWQDDAEVQGPERQRLEFARWLVERGLLGG